MSRRSRRSIAQHFSAGEPDENKNKPAEESVGEKRFIVDRLKMQSDLRSIWLDQCVGPMSLHALGSSLDLQPGSLIDLGKAFGLSTCRQWFRDSKQFQ